MTAEKITTQEEVDAYMKAFHKSRWEQIMKEVAEKNKLKQDDRDRRWLDKYHELVANGMDSDDAEVEVDNILDEEDAEEEEDNSCPQCDGTGIGQFGDPDTSRCSACNGKGIVQDKSEDYDDYEPEDDIECHKYYDGE